MRAWIVAVAMCAACEGPVTDTTDTDGNDAGTDADTTVDFDDGTDLMDPMDELRRGLVLHYPFDGDTDDAGTGGHHGTMSGVASFVDTQTGQGLAFDNPAGNALATTFVSIPDLTAVADPGEASVVICYHSTDATQDNGRLFGNWASASETSWSLVYHASSYAHAHEGARSPTSNIVTRDIEPAIVTTDGDTHCQALVIDVSAGTMRGIVDDVRDVELPFEGAAINWQGLVVGATGTSDRYAARDTVVDDFRLYDRALLPADVAFLRSTLVAP